MDARTARPVNGWCSWYYYFEKIDQPSFEKNLEQAKKLNPKIELFQLDEGYESNVGDWLEWNPKFPAGPGALAQKVHDAGFKAGIWIAPFLASRQSRLYKEHRDWFLKNKRGSPVLAMTNPNFKGFFAYALDATNPEFQKWLKELIGRLVHDYGFDYLKLDFIYAASLYGKRSDPKATGAAALRKGLEVIREAAGEKTYILGCGAPFGPTIGLVDAMRVSQDTDRRWKNTMDLAFGIEIAPAMRSCFKQNICRSLTGGRLWALDPDCLVLSTANKIDENDIKSQLTIFYMLAGQVLLSEDLQKLSRQQLDWFSYTLPAPERAAEPIDLFDRAFPQELFLAGEDMNLLALFNWSDRPQPCKINLLKYGLRKKYHAFEFWGRKYHGEVEGRWESGKINPRAVKFFALTEVKDRPQIIGLDFHLGMGKDYAELKSSGKSSKVVALINLPGKRKGSLHIKFPDRREPRQVAVEFEDKLALEIE
jgi:alpha-galactosidase